MSDFFGYVIVKANNCVEFTIALNENYIEGYRVVGSFNVTVMADGSPQYTAIMEKQQ